MHLLFFNFLIMYQTSHNYICYFKFKFQNS